MRRIKFNLSTFMKWFGFFAPAPIISLFSITAYVWFLMILFLIIILYSFKDKFKYSKRFDKSYLSYILIVYISSLLCLLRMPDIWKADIITLTIQFTTVLLIYIFFDIYKKVDVIIAFVKGIYISSVTQMIWGYLQLALGHVGIDLNSLIFGKILHMYTGIATHYNRAGEIKVSAFCWNAGNFAPLMIIGLLLSRNILAKIAFIVISFISGSRTLIFGMFFCVFIKTVADFFKKKKISRNKMAIICCFIILGFSVFILNSGMIITKISKALSSLNVIANYKTEASTNTHVMYLLRIFDVTSKNDIITNLFGYGPKCSGYAFVKHYNFYSDIGKWSVECDYINCLWNYGYLGFLTYYIWLIKNIVHCKRRSNNYMYIVLFSTLLVMGFMYNITFSWVSLFFIFLFVLNKHGIDIFELDSNW